MTAVKTFDECYFVNYNSSSDLSLYEIGRQACPPSYSYGPIIRNHYIFHYLIAGKGTLYMNNQAYKVQAKEGFIIPPNILAYYSADDLDPWNYIWLHLDGPRANQFFDNINLDFTNPVFHPTNPQNGIIQILYDLLKHNDRELYCIGKTYELFDLIDALSTEHSLIQADANLQYIKKIIDFIHIKYTEPIHMADLAHACGLERSYMTKLFKNATGNTPQKYLFSYRMKQAIKILQTKHLSVQDTAYSVGYGDAFTFSKAFKRYTGKAPSEYYN